MRHWLLYENWHGGGERQRGRKEKRERQTNMLAGAIFPGWSLRRNGEEREAQVGLLQTQMGPEDRHAACSWRPPW